MLNINIYIYVLNVISQTNRPYNTVYHKKEHTKLNDTATCQRCRTKTWRTHVADTENKQQHLNASFIVSICEDCEAV